MERFAKVNRNTGKIAEILNTFRNLSNSEQQSFEMRKLDDAHEGLKVGDVFPETKIGQETGQPASQDARQSDPNDKMVGSKSGQPASGSKSAGAKTPYQE